MKNNEKRGKEKEVPPDSLSKTRYPITQNRTCIELPLQNRRKSLTQGTPCPSPTPPSLLRDLPRTWSLSHTITIRNPLNPSRSYPLLTLWESLV